MQWDYHKIQSVKQKVHFKNNSRSFKNNFLLKCSYTIDDSNSDSNEENDELAEEKLGILNLDGWTSFVGSTDDISKIINMRLCLTLAYREFLKNKMISQHSVIIYFILKHLILFLIIIICI